MSMKHALLSLLKRAWKGKHPEEQTVPIIPGNTRIKSIRSDPQMCDGGNGRLLCWWAKGSKSPQVAIKVERWPLCLISRVGTPGWYFRWCDLVETSGSYVLLVSMTSIMSWPSWMRDSIKDCKFKMNCRRGWAEVHWWYWWWRDVSTRCCCLKLVVSPVVGDAL
jgi:hypothetical protein